MRHPNDNLFRLKYLYAPYIGKLSSPGLVKFLNVSLYCKPGIFGLSCRQL